jgi:superfamily I DNA/RNA helicase
VFTDEQQTIIDTIVKSNETLFKVSSVAGSGKTHTLRGVANALQPKKGLYIAFNKSVATEAKMNFPSFIECKTIHALAYQYVIAGTSQTIEELSIDSIKTKHKPYVKRQIIEAMNTFFNSAELSLSFIDELLSAPHAKIAKQYIEDMIDHKKPATFGFIMKYFYLQLHAGNIEVEYDLVMVDEAGDLSEVTVEIFKLIKAPKKVMVGDPHQNIYAFINTVNGFEVLKDEGISLELSQSFRVRADIAKRIEGFCQKYMNKDMHFRGIEIDESEIKNRMFISRTNSQLINRMIALHTDEIQYSTLREPKDIFALPLALISVSTGKQVYRNEFKYLERDYTKFMSDAALRDRYGKFHSYLRELHGDDQNLVTALRLLETHSYKTIFETYNLAKSQPKKAQAITLATAHVSKGSTYDSVYIENDLNNVIDKIIEKGGPENEDDMIELNLYYVACSRCRLELLNANHL